MTPSTPEPHKPGSDESKTFDGPMVRAAIFRRNVCRNNASFQISAATEDAIVEHCTVRDSEVGIRVAPAARGTLLRANEFSRVAQPEPRSP